MPSEPYLPIPEKFWVMFPKADKFLVSFPRSGSRWLRLLLNDLDAVNSGTDPNIHYQNLLTKRIPQNANTLNETVMPPACGDIYHLVERGFSETSNNISSSQPYIFRSHSLSCLEGRANCKVVYLLRDPIAMLNSYIHFSRKHGFISTETDELVKFCMSRIEVWGDHVEHAVSYIKSNPESACLIHYLDERPFSIKQIQKISEILEFPMADHQVEQAFDRLDHYLHQLNLTGGFDYVRGSNRAKNQTIPGLTDELIDILKQRALPIFEEARKISIGSN